MSRRDEHEPDDLVGTVLQGRYKVIRQIGSGSVGRVYEVEHTLIHKRFALKTLHPDSAENADAVARFHREARAAGAIGHEHIVAVTDMGLLPDDSPYLVLELLEGHTVGQELRRRGPYSLRRAAHIAEQCCRALDAAHSKGIVHRDLKPDNIFLVTTNDRPDFVKLLDFGMSKIIEANLAMGLAHSTRTGITVGTPYYMSPEQVSGDRTIDGQTDVWALGVVLFEMLTGQTPFKGPSFAVLAIHILTDPAPLITDVRGDIPHMLAAIVHRALEKERSNRFPNAAAFADDLATFLAATDDEVRRPTRPPPPAPAPAPAAADDLPISAIILGLLSLNASGLMESQDPTAVQRVTFDTAADGAPVRLESPNAPAPEPPPDTPAAAEVEKTPSETPAVAKAEKTPSERPVAAEAEETPSEKPAAAEAERPPVEAPVVARAEAAPVEKRDAEAAAVAQAAGDRGVPWAWLIVAAGFGALVVWLLMSHGR